MIIVLLIGFELFEGECINLFLEVVKVLDGVVVEDYCIIIKFFFIVFGELIVKFYMYIEEISFFIVICVG